MHFDTLCLNLRRAQLYLPWFWRYSDVFFFGISCVVRIVIASCRGDGAGFCLVTKAAWCFIMVQSASITSRALAEVSRRVIGADRTPSYVIRETLEQSSRISWCRRMQVYFVEGGRRSLLMLLLEFR